MFSKGQRVRVKQKANLYKASDEPTIIGALEIGVRGTVTLGPHMGKVLVDLDDGRNGWIANGNLERTSS